MSFELLHERDLPLIRMSPNPCLQREIECHSDGRCVLRGRGGVLLYRLSPRVSVLGCGVIDENTVWKVTLPAVESEY